MKPDCYATLTLTGYLREAATPYTAAIDRFLFQVLQLFYYFSPHPILINLHQPYRLKSVSQITAALSIHLDVVSGEAGPGTT